MVFGVGCDDRVKINCMHGSYYNIMLLTKDVHGQMIKCSCPHYSALKTLLV